MQKNQIAILDAGGQYAKVIDRKVRELGVESILLPMNTSAEELKKYAAVIISGGPQSVYGKQAPKYDQKLIKLNKPILGICYGMQLLVYASRGTIEKKSKREDGLCQIKIDPRCPLFTGLKKKQVVLMSHGDSVAKLSKEYQIVADSAGLIAAIACPSRKHYGVQFHPEVDLTENGRQILSNFLFKIANLKANFTIENREEKAITYIQESVGEGQVLLLASGGVDSTVTAALLRKALKPEQIIAVHIDNGFMRQNESQKVKTALSKIGIELTILKAQKDFSEATTSVKNEKIGPLCLVTDPQQKRQIVGDTFIKITEAYLRTLNLDLDQVFLVQGTLRPDLIESASKSVSQAADRIKTHHNDTDVVRSLRERGRVIEPLVDYHKDEVRQLGEQLGLPSELVWRQPFPGPGLSIRILCAKKPYVTLDYDQLLCKLQTFVKDPYRVTLLPIRSVGVQGDGRTYSYAAAISIAAGEKINWLHLMNLAREIPKVLHQINRVTFVFGEPIDRSIKTVTPTLLNEANISKLRAADQIVNDLLYKHDLLRKISQVPVILIPIDFGETNESHSIVIRTFITNDFMTGLAATPSKEIPEKVLTEMVSEIKKQVSGISRVLYDLTSKPPGTTEWE